MRILFVHPRWERFLEARPELADLPYARRLDSFRVSPLSIPTVAALTPAGIDVDLLDDFQESIEPADPPDLVAISAFTPAATRAFEIADTFRARGVPVVLGGLHPTVLPEEAREHADAVVAGEAEGVWPDVVEDVRQGRLQPLYRRKKPAPLHGLPSPRRDLFREKGLTAISVVQSGRGCPRRCPTCVIPQTAGPLRTRPVEEVVEEIQGLDEPSFYLSEESLLFPDEANRRFAIELFEGIQDLGKTFFIASYPFLLEHIDGEILSRLARAGNRQFYIVFGVDDAGPDALWGRVDPVRKEIERLGEAGISVMGSFALGGDRDGPDCFEKVWKLARDLEINLAEFFLLTPYPGTPLFRKMEKQGRILTREWKRYNGAHAVFQPRKMSPEELEEGFVDLWRAFYGDMNGYDSTLRFARGFGTELIRRQNRDPEPADEA